MPVCWMPRILWMVEHGDGNGVGADSAGENTPVAAGAPGCVAFFSFAGEVCAVDAVVVHFCYLRGVPSGVGEDFGLVGGGFEGAGYADAEQAFFVVLEDYLFGLGLQRGDAINGPGIFVAAENEFRVFFEDELILAGDPVGFGD